MSAPETFHTPTSLDEVRAVLDETIKFCEHAIAFANSLVALGLLNTPRAVIAYKQYADELAEMLRIVRAGDKRVYDYAPIIPLCGTIKKEIKGQIRLDIARTLNFVDEESDDWLNDVGASLDVTPLGRRAMLDRMKTPFSYEKGTSIWSGEAPNEPVFTNRDLRQLADVVRLFRAGVQLPMEEETRKMIEAIVDNMEQHCGKYPNLTD